MFFVRYKNISSEGKSEPAELLEQIWMGVEMDLV